MHTQTGTKNISIAQTLARKAVIIGGGIGGLTTAIALQQRGVDAHVYEAAPEIHAVGAGIWVAPNALTVFQRLGFLDEIISGGFNVTSSCISDTTGRMLQSFSPSEMSTSRLPLVPIHRAVLQEHLIAQLKPNTLHLAKRCTGIEQHENGVTVQFEDGSTAMGDILIGADGIRSVVRTALFGATDYRYSGQTCWRGIVNFRMPEASAATEMWSTKPGVRLGYSHVNAEQVYFYATTCAPHGGNDTPGTIRQRLAELYSDFPLYLLEMLAAADESKIIRNDIWDFAPISSWHKGRVVLLGDAAHATTPNMGQGGCQAIEDAYALAEALSLETSLGAAFKHYETSRMKKAHFVVNTSYRIGKITNWGGTKAHLRNMAVSLAPKSAAKRQFNYLFNLEF
ncbi:MAG: FAD-dependent monooxygenase [Ignavibacteria bacterium]|nr:FAD-dependent monooxygenase [Ignavibacteria bacterium]